MELEVPLTASATQPSVTNEDNTRKNPCYHWRIFHPICMRSYRKFSIEPSSFYRKCLCWKYRAHDEIKATTASRNAIFLCLFIQKPMKKCFVIETRCLRGSRRWISNLQFSKFTFEIWILYAVPPFPRCSRIPTIPSNRKSSREDWDHHGPRHELHARPFRMCSPSKNSSSCCNFPSKFEHWEDRDVDYLWEV